MEYYNCICVDGFCFLLTQSLQGRKKQEKKKKFTFCFWEHWRIKLKPLIQQNKEDSCTSITHRLIRKILDFLQSNIHDNRIQCSPFFITTILLTSKSIWGLPTKATAVESFLFVPALYVLTSLSAWALRCNLLTRSSATCGLQI